MKYLFAVFFLLIPSVGLANDRANLIAAIENAGKNEVEDKRHAVEIDECTMTTYVWKPFEDHGFQLWSSWQIDLRGLAPITNHPTTQKGFLVLNQFGEDQEPNENTEVMILLDAKQGWTFRHEQPMSRTPRQPYVESPREGVEDYVYSDKSGLMIRMQGVEVVDKADTFTNALVRYASDYCILIG